jgi:hypothetical protein
MSAGTLWLKKNKMADFCIYFSTVTGSPRGKNNGCLPQKWKFPCPF